MSIIATDTEHMFRRAASAVTVIQSIERHLNAEEAEVLEGGSVPRDGSPAPITPTVDPEPPTGVVDPTGDLATSGRLNRIRNSREKLSLAFAGVDKAFNHLDLVARAVLSTNQPKPEPVNEPDLCAGPACNRHKEPGSDLCIGCGMAHASLEREQEHPVCGSLGCDRSVERYKTAAGDAYRGMYYDGAEWMPNSDTAPTCSTCRRSEQLAA